MAICKLGYGVIDPIPTRSCRIHFDPIPNVVAVARVPGNPWLPLPAPKIIEAPPWKLAESSGRKPRW